LQPGEAEGDMEITSLADLGNEDSKSEENELEETGEEQSFTT
jgi:hypothetical protein